MWEQILLAARNLEAVLPDPTELSQGEGQKAVARVADALPALIELAESEQE